jgi:hypothetical protein
MHGDGAGRSDVVLWHGLFAPIQLWIGAPATGVVSDGSAGGLLVFVHFNTGMFVGPVLMGAVMATSSSTSSSSLTGLHPLSWAGGRIPA